MEPLHIFGFCALAVMLVFYALEDRSAWCILGFAAMCVLSSIYGFMAGTWPFGAMEIIWTIVAVRRWWKRWQAEQKAGSAEGMVKPS